MKTLTFFILVLCFANVFSQNRQTNNTDNRLSMTKDSQRLKSIRVTVRDSASHKLIKNHPITFFHNRFLKRTDSTGKIVFSIDKDSSVSVKCAGLDGYYDKSILVNSEKENYFLDLVSFGVDPDRSFAEPGKALDTSYYKNGKIEKIKYTYKRFQNEITYYESGLIKLELINGDSRERYKNGKIKHYTIYVTHNSRIEAEYYENGKLKSKGILESIEDPQTKKKNWVKNKDWKTYGS